MGKVFDRPQSVTRPVLVQEDEVRGLEGRVGSFQDLNGVLAYALGAIRGKVDFFVAGYGRCGLGVTQVDLSTDAVDI